MCVFTNVISVDNENKMEWGVSFMGVISKDLSSLLEQISLWDGTNKQEGARE